VGVCRDIYWVLVGNSKGASVDSFLSEKAGGSKKTRVENASRGGPSTVWPRRGSSQLLVLPHLTREGVFVMTTA